MASAHAAASAAAAAAAAAGAWGTMAMHMPLMQIPQCSYHY